MYELTVKTDDGYTVICQEYQTLSAVLRDAEYWGQEEGYTDIAITPLLL